ncbi:unnamed protein product [Linum trigynum]|uniref:Uncharacterized protein n=1 Tax=Linum trigynum TaxID=586398 RepID=A0AAV2DIY5_9ROSI
MGSEPAKVSFGDKVDSRSIKELVLSLKSEFQSSKFEYVASVLASREEKLKREIAAKGKENRDLLLDKEQARLYTIKLEVELKKCADRVNSFEEEMKKLQVIHLASSADAGRGRVQASPENHGESVQLTAEGNGIASASGVKKVDGNKQLNLEMNVKKEKEDSVSEGIRVCKKVDERDKLGIEMNAKKENEEAQNGGNGKIGLSTSANLKSYEADTSAGKHGNTRPTPAAGTFIELSDSDDECTPSKAQKEGTPKQLHAGAGHSGKLAVEDGTGVLKRNYSISGENDKSGRPEKLTKHQDVIHIGRTVAASANQRSLRPYFAALAAASSSSSSTSSDDEFDIVH